MYQILMVVYLLVALAIIGFVLMQQGKGADMGASFGSGGSNTVFGASGSGNFLTRTTSVLAVLFFVLSLALGNLSTKPVEDVILDAEKPTVVQDVPAQELPPQDVPAEPVNNNSDVPQ